MNTIAPKVGDYVLWRFYGKIRQGVVKEVEPSPIEIEVEPGNTIEKFGTHDDPVVIVEDKQNGSPSLLKTSELIVKCCA